MPYGKKTIGTNWVYRNKKDERGIVVRNKARLVAQGYKQEKGVDYDEVFAPVARIEGIKLFLAYASFMNFLVYQMDVKSAFLYGTIEEEVYVRQPPSFVDLEFLEKVYKTKIHVDNESAIYVVNNPVYHSKSKHIEIRHHFIRDSYKKKLIEMVKIHTNYDVADLLTKAFDVTRFQFLIASIDKKELAIPGQTATGKEFSNPLMAGSLPKTISGLTLVKRTKQVLDLEKEKDAQAVEILNLKRRVKKLEKKEVKHLIPNKEKMQTNKDFEKLDDYMENDEEETVNAAATRVSTVSAPVSTAGVTISTAKPRTPPTTTTVFDNENVTIEMAQTLIKMKEQKAKEKGVAITDVEDSSRIVRPVRSITTLQPLPTIYPKDKGKGVLVEEEPVKIKMRDQGDLQKRQRQEDDTNATLAKEFDEIQARIDVDRELAVRLAHEEQEKAEAIRNKPPTKTQVRNRMITYLEHMGKYTHQQLKNKTYEEIQILYEKEKRWIDDFQPMDTKTIKDSEKKVDSSSKPTEGSRKKTLTRKRAGEKNSEESNKKKKLEDVAEEQESAKIDKEIVADYELKEC
ncbi:putative ribonuclease H-like domain-containing protein [Tanacetum coccineum]